MPINGESAVSYSTTSGSTGPPPSFEKLQLAVKQLMGTSFSTSTNQTKKKSKVYQIPKKRKARGMIRYMIYADSSQS